ncbi:MAG: SagB/ThcOx family dehydrogenase [Halanaerobiaceae bacterium]
MSIGKDFMEETKYQNLGKSEQDKGIEQPGLQKELDGGKETIDLPQPSDIKIGNYDLRKAFEERRSLRSYADTPLSLEELSFLLWVSQGVKKEVKGKATFRNVPSAGARHAFETYILINRVEGLEKGIYYFNALEHKLIPYKISETIDNQVVKGCFNQAFIKESAVTFIWTAVKDRMNWRYGERGYRYLHLDAGHVCQNIYLAAEAIDSGVCAIAAYSDDDINDLLEVDGEEQFAIYLASLGKK